MKSGHRAAIRLLQSAWERFPGILALSALLILAFANPGPISALRHQLFDLYQRFEPRASEPLPLSVVDIDDASLRQQGQWPWPRRQIARLLDTLGTAGAAVIVLDMVFAEADRFSAETLRTLVPESWPLEDLADFDRQLAEVISRYRVIGGVALGADPSEGETGVKAGFATLGTSPLDYLRDFPGALVNLPTLAESFSGIGSFSVELDRDATVRSLPLLQRHGEQIVPALALETLRVAQGAGTIAVRSAGAGDPVPGARIVRAGALEIPVSPDARMWLHYSDDIASNTIPAWQVLKPTTDLADRVSGHIVLVGSSAPGLGEFVTTPRHVSEPALRVHAQAIEQMLQGRFLQRPTWAPTAEWLALLGLGLLVVVLTPRVGVAIGGLLTLTLVVAGAIGGWLAFREYRLLIDPAVPALALTLVYLTTSLSVFLRSERERVKIRRAFRQYLSPDLVEQLSEDPSRLRLGGESRELTFLFSDIAGFTSLTERTSAVDLVRLLNGYLDGACRVVMSHGGTIDKIVGDAVHAIFGAPLEQVDHAQRAVRCALALDEFANKFCLERRQEGVDFGITRIGVNTGTAVVGNFGGEGRFDYTAHGDAINTAARLEAANKVLGTRICIARSTADSCTEVAFRPIGILGLRGKSQGVEAFEPIGTRSTDRAPTQEYEASYERLQTSDDQGSQAMIQLAAQYPDDPLVAMHAARLGRGERGAHIKVG